MFAIWHQMFERLYFSRFLDFRHSIVCVMVHNMWKEAWALLRKSNSIFCSQGQRAVVVEATYRLLIRFIQTLSLPFKSGKETLLRSTSVKCNIWLTEKSRSSVMSRYRSIHKLDVTNSKMGSPPNLLPRCPENHDVHPSIHPSILLTHPTNHHKCVKRRFKVNPALSWSGNKTIQLRQGKPIHNGGEIDFCPIWLQVPLPVSYFSSPSVYVQYVHVDSFIPVNGYMSQRGPISKESSIPRDPYHSTNMRINNKTSQ